MEKPAITVALDLGDRFSHRCMLDEDGDAITAGLESGAINCG
ncbi:MAG: hypothetical protein ABSC48_03035 [Terracidiphilus sp.]|jgi:hypothetical protein